MNPNLPEKFINYITSANQQIGTVIRQGKYKVVHKDADYFETVGLCDAAFTEFVQDVREHFKLGNIYSITNEVITLDKHISLQFDLIIKKARGKRIAVIAGNINNCVIEIDNIFGIGARQYNNCIFSYEGRLFKLTDTDFVEVT